MTVWRTGCMIALAWLMGLGIGFVSVFSGIYSTDTFLTTAYSNPDDCSFKVILKPESEDL
jgi:hypothetical protein